ncbi:MAG TPA: trypsin-like peptidase domain-containing protein [Ilumatobacteraceae bacterium]
MIPVDQPSSQAPWPAPVASTMVRGLEPPIDHSQHPSGSPRRRRLALVAAVLVLLAAVAAVVRVESRQSGATSGSPTATTTTPTKASSGDDTLPTVAALPTTQAALDTDAIVALVDPAVADITLALDGGEAAGTGMVLTPSGLLLTNNHVIDGATDITVQIAATGPTHPAHVVGYDIVDDVALLQIEGVSGLKTVTPGDSGAVDVGDQVVTIGNALGASGPHAVTTGSIDALDQSVTANEPTGESQDLSGLIQIDARLRPGDSGGPLVNSAGQVIGMNSVASIGGRRFGRPNVGYAIPIVHALDIARQIQAGTASASVHIGDRAILGVQVTDATSPDTPGARVEAVSNGSPADDAGIRRDTVITSIDRAAITSVDDIGDALFPHSPGDSVEVTWTDPDGTSHTATVELAVGPPA